GGVGAARGGGAARLDGDDNTVAVADRGTHGGVRVVRGGVRDAISKIAVLLLLANAAWGESVKQGFVLRVHGPAGAVAARMGEKTVRLFAQDGATFGL